jgi:hypothetical protein
MVAFARLPSVADLLDDVDLEILIEQAGALARARGKS